MRDPPDSPQTETFAEFWRHYLRDHAQPGTRVLHFLGNGFGIASLLLGVITLNPMIPIVGIVIGYVFAWSGHLLIEHSSKHGGPSHVVLHLRCTDVSAVARSSIARCVLGN